jgi:hypothetical protein
MHNAALAALFNNDTQNHALCQILAPRLDIELLATWAQVCRAFRSWPVDNGTECFLGVTPFWPHNSDEDDEVPTGTLHPWKPHFELNGQPAMSKKNCVILHPQIYSVVSEHHDGKREVMAVPWGNQVEESIARIDAWLVDAVTGEEVEYLGDDRLFRESKPPKGVPSPYYRLNKPSFRIKKTLSNHYAPPKMFKLKVMASITLEGERWWANYSYTSDRFYVVSAQPVWGSSAYRKRRDEPYKRSRYGL